MRTVAVLSNKGGTGKTTLSLHLAVAALRDGMPAAVIDLDPQSSAQGWSESREGDEPIVSGVPVSRLSRGLEMVRTSGVGLAVLDTPPNTGEASVAAARLADLVLIPCRPGILDIRAIGVTAEAVRQSGKPGFVVLNAVPVQGSRVVEDASAACAQHGLSVAPVVLHQRAAYGHALTIGLTVQEYEPDGRAAEEVSALWAWIKTV